MADPLRQTYGEVFFTTSGLQRDPYGLANFHPASNVNRLDIYLEDGVSTNVVMVNFKADGKGYPTSVFFPTLYGGTVQKVITGEASARSFAKYSLLVPPQVLQWNANGTSTLGLQATVVQTAGDGLLGSYETYTALTTAHQATEALYDAGSVAYVYTTEGLNEYGFYTVTYNSGTTTYSWTAIENPVTQINLVDAKQYNIIGMQIQKGNLPRPTHGVTISDEYIRFMLASIASINDIALANQTSIGDEQTANSILGRIVIAEAYIDAIIDGSQDITYDPTVSGLVATTIKGAIDEIVGRLDTAEEDIDDLENRATALETFRDTTVPATYETIANADIIRGRTTDLETQVGTHADDIAVLKSDLSNAKQDIDTKEELLNKATNFSTINDIKYPSVKAVNDQLSFKVNKTQTIIGIDLQDNITLNEFKTALGNATQSVAGLLSAEDKTHLDGLVSLLESSDGNNVVDTIGEILEIFNNYPEGADLVTVLNGKVDKVAGKQLSTNDLTDTLKDYYDIAYAHSQIVNSNPHQTTYQQILDKPTTIEELGVTNVYTKPETYTRLEINNLLDNLSAVKGLKSTLLTPTELSNGDTISTNLLTNNGAYVVFTATDTLTGEIDSDTVPVSTIITGKKFVFFDNQETVFTIGETNSTFETSEDVTLKINLLYLDSENVQAVGVDFDGSLTNYLLTQTNVQEAIEKLDEELKTTNDNKVDKVTGKGLSTEDYTTTEKNKLSGIEAGAEVNVQSDWTQEVNTADDYIKNKPAIPTKTSDLTNDTGYITGYTETDPIFTAWDKSTGISITKSQITDLIEATQSLSGLMSATDKARLDTLHALLEEDTSNNVVDSINEVLAIFNNYPEGADLVTALAGKVDKIEGKGLSTNDYTNTDKQSVEKISTIEQDILDLESDKVDKIVGKGLSTEDYTSAEKNKLAELAFEIINVETWNTDMKTLALSDKSKLFVCSYTDNQTVTIPTHTSVPFITGTMITFLLTSSYSITFVGASGVTLTSMDNLVTLATQFAMASLIKIATDTWQLVGALE